MAEPLHQLKRPGVTITVFPGYVEIKKGWWVFGKTTTIPIRKIASVEANRGLERLTIVTDGKKKYQFNLGGLGGAAEGVRQAILQAMA
jgi:hypothetical protein